MVQEVTQAVEGDTLEQLLEEVTPVELVVATQAAEEATQVHPLNKVTLEQLHPHSRVVTEVPHLNRVATAHPLTVSPKLTPALHPGSEL